MTQETELKPCPFCGGEALAWSWSPHENAHYIGCKDECIPSFEGIWHEDEHICQKQWNTRAEDPTKAELIKALGAIYNWYQHSPYQGLGLPIVAKIEKALEKAKGDE